MGAAVANGAVVPPVRLVTWPDPEHENPYLSLCYAALRRQGIEYRGTFRVQDQWLSEQAGDVDVIHIHWPEFLWRRNGRSSLAHVRRLVRFLRAAGNRGVVRAWTVHNVIPHEWQFVDIVGMRMIAREVDVFACHSAQIEHSVRKWLRPRSSSRLVRMPIGNFADAYPRPGDPGQLAESLRIPPNRPIAVMVGQIRRYKGADVAVRAAGVLGEGVHLLIAGRVPDGPDTIAPGLDARANVTLLNRALSEQEVSDVLEFAEVVWLPYRRIWGSAVALLALTAGRGVIASDLPFFRELLDGEPDAGRLVAAGDAHALARATQEYLTVPRERRRTAALALASCYDWPVVVRDFAGVLKAAVAGARSLR